MAKGNIFTVGLKFMVVSTLALIVNSIFFVLFLFLTAGLASTTTQPALVFVVFLIFGLVELALFMLSAGFLSKTIYGWQ